MDPEFQGSALESDFSRKWSPSAAGARLDLEAVETTHHTFRKTWTCLEAHIDQVVMQQCHAMSTCYPS